MQSKEYKWLHLASYWTMILYSIFYVVFVIAAILPIPLMYISFRHLGRANKLYHDCNHECLIEDVKAVVWGFSALYVAIPILVLYIVLAILLTGGA